MTGEMGRSDYQLTRIGLLAVISDRARELGEDIFDEAEAEIEGLKSRLATAEAERDALHQAGGYLYSTLSVIQGGGFVAKDDMQRARAAWQRAILGVVLGTRGKAGT